MKSIFVSLIAAVARRYNLKLAHCNMLCQQQNRKTEFLVYSLFEQTSPHDFSGVIQAPAPYTAMMKFYVKLTRRRLEQVKEYIHFRQTHDKVDCNPFSSIIA
jgi:hypothetical protein